MVGLIIQYIQIIDIFLFLAVKRITRRAKANLKPFDKLSRAEQCRRRKIVATIAPGAKLTSALTVEDSLRMQIEGNLSERNMAAVKKRVPGSMFT